MKIKFIRLIQTTDGNNLIQGKDFGFEANTRGVIVSYPGGVQRLYPWGNILFCELEAEDKPSK